MRFKRIVAIVLTFVCLMSVGGVAAAWTYADGPISPIQQLLDIVLWSWTETPGGDQGDETKEEVALRDAFADILNGVENDTLITDGSEYDGMTKQQAFEAIIEERKTENVNGIMQWMGYGAKEVGLDDPDTAYLKTLLGVKDDSTLSCVIKFTTESTTNPGYELYTTRIDVNGFDDKDEDGVQDDGEENFIPWENVEAENYYIYPVNKTTFVKKTETVDGQQVTSIVEDKMTVGYSRCIRYYEDYNTPSNTIRSFDVTQWKEGTESDAVLLDDNNKEYFIYSDIGQAQQTVYFRYGNLAANGNFTGANFPAATATTPSVSSVTTQAVDSRYKFTRGVGGNNQYATLTYTPSGEDPSPTNPHAIKITLTT